MKKELMILIFWRIIGIGKSDAACEDTSLGYKDFPGGEVQAEVI